MTTQCPKCNTKNPDDSKFCKECASPLKHQADVSVTRTIKTPSKGISKGTTIAGKYQILQKLGEGGMGTVFKAKDSRLDRTVALKFLSSDLIKDKEAKKRFIQEAKAAAALEHPNICTVYEVDRADGQTFIAMSYIEGQSLKDKLKEGPLDVDEAKDIALQVAGGLKEAHEKGIVHRDIKPANIMLTKKNQAKITDFGLAKVSWGVDLTKTSTIMGTVAYMSPEQARGKKVDHRTDIWSLGAMLYEMLTGERPFQSQYDQAVLHAVLHENPEPLANLRKDISPSIVNVVSKALEKDPARRHQSMEQLLNELEKTSRQAVLSFEKQKSIAVLPFENMSADPEQEYFCDGIAEEIINTLTQIENLRVIARTSAFSFKGKREDVREIGRKLGVETLLEGSVRKSGNRLRITTQLINVVDGSHIWSDRFDRQIKDIFDIQVEIALTIMEKLKIKLGGEERDKLVKHPTEHVEAYSLYLKGRYFLGMLTEEMIKKGLGYFNQAIKNDPSFALAHAGLADHFTWKGVMGFMPLHQAYANAKENAEKALSLDDSLAEAHTSVGLIKFYFEWLWGEAEIEFKRAIELNPGSIQVHYYYALYLGLMGRFEESIVEARQNLDFDPLSPVANQNLGFILFTARKYDESILQLKKTLELNPNHAYARVVLAWDYAFKTMYSEAIDEGKRAEQLSKGIDYWLQGSIACIHAFSGKKNKAIKLLDRLRELAQDGYVDPGYFAVLHAAIGEKEQAFEWLNKVFEDRSPWMVYLKNYTLTFFKNLSSDPRYSELLNKAGLEIDPSDFSRNLQDLNKDLTATLNTPQNISGEKSIIVLPFEDISPDRDNEYFSDGLTEEIITDLSHIHGLRVISRSSAMTFKGTSKKIGEIADEVKVQYVLEGSVRKAGNDLRITAQLIDAKNDAQLWAEKYSGTMDDIFDIQEKVSRSIVDALKIKLSPEEEEKIAERPIENIQAYECYIKARPNIYRWEKDALDRALNLLQNGLKIIGDNEILYAGLGITYVQYWNTGIKRDKSYLHKAEEYSNKVFEINPKSPQGHYLRGFIFWKQGKVQEAVRELKQSLLFDPNNLDGLLYLAWIYGFSGKASAARPHLKRLLEIDPLTPINHLVKGLDEQFEGKFEEAIESFRTAYQLESDDPWDRFLNARALAFCHRLDEAFKIIDLIVKDTPHSEWAQLGLFLKCALLGEKTRALQSVTKDLIQMMEEDEIYPIFMAESYSLIDEREKAINWIERALKCGFINFPFLNEIDLFLENIRGEPRFKKLMKRVKHEWENFEV
jgi:serine/threonine-protein kinase